MKDGKIRREVRKGYAKIAKGESSGCSPLKSCCGSDPATNVSKSIGYSERDMASVPDGSNLGLGCGNPVALASLKKGEVVLDLGSGAGFDCFLAAKKVGKTGKVIGVDMTPEMLEKARENAEKSGFENVEFRLGEIENLPVADGSADIIISNCVINLSTDKKRVFGEAYRVLKPGGRLMVSDIVLLKPLPKEIRASIAAYVGCLAGASMRGDYLKLIEKAGFKGTKVVDETPFPVELMSNDPIGQAVIEGLDMPMERLKDIARAVVSIKVHAVKPK